MHAWHLYSNSVLISFMLILTASAEAESGRSGNETVKTPGNAHILKWVDEKGVTHYGDTMPIQDAGRANSEMTKQGIVVKRKQLGSSPEAAIKKDPEQERRDHALLASYTNEQEIDLTRDRNLELVQTNKKALESNLEAAQRQLYAYKKQADAMTSKKKKLPDDLTADIQTSQAKVDKIQFQLKQTLADMDATRARFDQDKLRFRELKAVDAAKQP